MLQSYTLDTEDVQQAIAEWMLRHLEIKIDPSDVDIQPWLACSCGCECESEDIIDYGVEVTIDVEDVRVGD